MALDNQWKGVPFALRTINIYMYMCHVNVGNWVWFCSCFCFYFCCFCYEMKCLTLILIDWKQEMMSSTVQKGQLWQILCFNFINNIYRQKYRSVSYGMVQIQKHSLKQRRFTCKCFKGSESVSLDNLQFFKAVLFICFYTYTKLLTS